MELAARPTFTAGVRPILRPWQAEQAITWSIGFVPVAYLALSGGGYDTVVRSEVGIIVWWAVLLGVVAGVLPRTRWTWPAWTAAGLLAGFAIWTSIGIVWSPDEGHTLTEVGRVAAYLGVFVLGACLVTRANVGALLSGLACAVLLVSGLSVLSQLEPSWFAPPPATAVYQVARLSYPFDYPDGVGEFAALGLPLLLFAATGARTIAVRAGAAAGLPVVLLCLAMTASRGGVLALVAGLVVFFALAPDRVTRVATGAAAAIASAVPLAVFIHHSGSGGAFLPSTSPGTRHTLLVVLLLSCAAAALLQVAITLVIRHGIRPRWLRVSRRQAAVVAAAIAVAVIGVVVVGAAGGTVHHLWQDFKRPNPSRNTNLEARLLSISGSHRYQYWKAAISGFHTHPWRGIGPGTFQFYWAQHNSLSEYVVNAHSLYIETLSETGIIGLALVGGFVVFVLGYGSVRALRATAGTRLAIATAVATFAAFAAAAAFDWLWQIAAAPMVALPAAAIVVSGLRDRERIGAGQRLLATRLAIAAAALVSLWAIIVPLATTVEVRTSQAAVRSGNTSAALRDAGTAQRLEPSSSTPRLQRALLLEALGDYVGATKAVVQAERRGPTDYTIWLIASRIAVESGRPRLALADWRRARRLNPTLQLFG